MASVEWGKLEFKYRRAAVDLFVQLQVHSIFGCFANCKSSRGKAEDRIS